MYGYGLELSLYTVHIQCTVRTQCCVLSVSRTVKSCIFIIPPLFCLYTRLHARLLEYFIIQYTVCIVYPVIYCITWLKNLLVLFCVVGFSPVNNNWKLFLSFLPSKIFVCKLPVGSGRKQQYEIQVTTMLKFSYLCHRS